MYHCVHASEGTRFTRKRAARQQRQGRSSTTQPALRACWPKPEDEMHGGQAHAAKTKKDKRRACTHAQLCRSACIPGRLPCTSEHSGPAFSAFSLASAAADAATAAGDYSRYAFVAGTEQVYHMLSFSPWPCPVAEPCHSEVWQLFDGGTCRCVMSNQRNRVWNTMCDRCLESVALCV